MAGGPLQVVLDPGRFRDDRRSAQGGGAGKDFFRGLNQEFIEHRDNLVEGLRNILLRHNESSLINVVVVMRPDALAKSHRPFAKLFAQSRANHVGTAHYGELIFATSTIKLRSIIGLLAVAEQDVATKVDARGIERYSPTLNRSEASAIESVREWRASEERGFSLDDADAWIGEAAGSKLEIDIFAVPKDEPMRSETLLRSQELARLIESSEGLLRGDFPLELKSNSGHSGASEQILSVLSQPVETPQISPSSAFDARVAIGATEQFAIVKRVRLQDKLADFEDAPHYLAASRDADGPEILPSATKRRGSVGVIDGGVLGPIKSRVIGGTDLIADEHRSLKGTNHASEIASIIAIGSSLNPSLLPVDEDCDVYDLGILPDTNFTGEYYGSLEDFFDELREGVRRAHDAFGVRIFNLSSVLRQAPGSGSYSLATRRLDEIAAELDVIFVVSVGNLSTADQRIEWPVTPADALAALAQSGAPDGVRAPSDSLLNLGIGAVNPPGLAFEIEGAPARYTRRGGRMPSAIKPDLAAYGGAAPDSARGDSGLRAMNAFGNVNNVRGTSYSAPIVARYLAALDAAVVGSLTRESLLALAIHHAQTPPILSHKALKPIAQSFVGHGVPISVADTLDGDAHRMTILLTGTVMPKRGIYFPFTWPASLSDPDGRCRGVLRLTIVTRPQINYVHGEEMVRINLDAAVKQANSEGIFLRKTQPTHQFFSGFTFANERTLSTELGKWHPILSYEAVMARGVGRSTDWALEIDYLTRAGEQLPDSGVDFAVVMTIEDPAGEAPVFNEMRADLISIGVSLSDLRTSVNVSVPT